MPLQVSFFSGIVTVEGIVSRYPGGLATFDSDYPRAQSNATLRLVSYMSCHDLEGVVACWEAKGLRFGWEIAIGDMQGGRLNRVCWPSAFHAQKPRQSDDGMAKMRWCGLAPMPCLNWFC